MCALVRLGGSDEGTLGDFPSRSPPPLDRFEEVNLNACMDLLSRWRVLSVWKDELFGGKITAGQGERDDALLV